MLCVQGSSPCLPVHIREDASKATLESVLVWWKPKLSENTSRTEVLARTPKQAAERASLQLARDREKW